MRALVSGGVVALVLATTAPAGGVSTSGNPFDEARAAARRLAFMGSVDISWEDATGRHSDQLVVRASGGSFQVQGGSTVMAEADGARMVRRPGGDWDLLWSGTQTSAGRPDPHAKYEIAPVVTAEPTRVAARPTELVEIRQAGVVRERLYLDAANGLLLRREQLDGGGRATRVVTFSFIDFEPDTAIPASPSRLTDHSPRRMTKVKAPAELPGGYHRVDAYREGDTEHVLYSDGLYDVSVFRQRGALADRDLPASGTQVRVGSAPGWVYAWPGGQVLVWHAGHNVYSMVGEAPAEELIAAARAVPTTGGSSLVDRMRRACRNLLEPLAA